MLYPQNSPKWPLYDPHDEARRIDLRQEIDSEAQRLFTPTHDGHCVHVAKVISQSRITTGMLTSEEEVQTYIGQLTPAKPEGNDSEKEVNSNTRPSRGHNFILLQPFSGWDRLSISKDSMLAFLSFFEVFPAFFRYLKTYGLKNFVSDVGFSGYDWSADEDLSVLEMCYLLKYVESQDSKDVDSSPWSIRDALIYQKVNLRNDETSQILVRLSERMNRRLAYAIEDEASSREGVWSDWTKIHSLCLDSIDTDLRSCINNMYKQLHNVVARIVMAGIEPGKLNILDTVESAARDLKDLQSHENFASRLGSSVEVNINALSCMARRVSELLKSWDGDPARRTHCMQLQQFSSTLERIRQEQAFALKNITALVEQVRLATSQLRDTIALRNSEITIVQTRLANENSEAIVNFSKKSQNEAHVVKTLTVLALVFVPASFVADFLQMGYVTLGGRDGTKWIASQDLQIFAALVFPLMAIVMGLYAFVELTTRRLPNYKANLVTV